MIVDIVMIAALTYIAIRQHKIQSILLEVSEQCGDMKVSGAKLLEMQTKTIERKLKLLKEMGHVPNEGEDL